ncbi:DUF418 domain-containing protein [Brachybacterium hainanense]|uniref:DUF418 domain-containing protein n=1 Tax=Brachybacterium hainanense TaxID=1541174 RepID=A0ABV6RAL2_9MICO
MSTPAAPSPPPAAPSPGAASAQVPERSLAPDLARGLMLALIALANVSWHLWGRPTQMTGAHPLEGSTLDRILQAIMMIAVDGRSYPLFAFLFGYGMVQFTRSRIERGLPEADVRRMLRRRHAAMILFGLVHASLLFMGDVLGAYGLAGLLLVWLFFRRRDRTLIIWSSVLAGLLALYALISVAGGALLIAFAPEGAAGEFVMADPQDVTAGSPSYLASILPRTSIWAGLTIAQVVSLTIPLSILLGWLAARHRLLEDPAAHLPLLRRLALIGIPIGWLGALPGALTSLDVLPVREDASWMFMGLSSVTGVCTGVGYAAAFALLAARLGSSRPPIVRAIAAVGKRSLSFYLLQSLVFAIVLSAWGLGVGGWAGTSLALLIGLLTWALGVPLAMLLEQRGARGPAEVLLRRLTYGRRTPNR